MVVILAPSAVTARVRQELMRRPSTSTVQAPHWPWSQPFLLPVSARVSRSASRRVVRVSRVRAWDVPLTLRVRLTVCGVLAAAACPSCAVANCGRPVARAALRMPVVFTKVRRENSVSTTESLCESGCSDWLVEEISSRGFSMSVQAGKVMVEPQNALMMRERNRTGQVYADEHTERKDAHKNVDKYRRFRGYDGRIRNQVFQTLTTNLRRGNGSVYGVQVSVDISHINRWIGGWAGSIDGFRAGSGGTAAAWNRRRGSGERRSRASDSSRD